MSWETLPCVPYGGGRGNSAYNSNVVCFNAGAEGVLLVHLLEKNRCPNLARAAEPGLPEDVATKISIRIEVSTSNVGLKAYWLIML